MRFDFIESWWRRPDRLRFNRNEFAGALGDIGTSLPLLVGVTLAAKLNVAAQMTAANGLSTRVPTIVAIAFAESWKPLMKSKTKATRTIRRTKTTVPFTMRAPGRAAAGGAARASGPASASTQEEHGAVTTSCTGV